MEQGSAVDGPATQVSGKSAPTAPSELFGSALVASQPPLAPSVSETVGRVPLQPCEQGSLDTAVGAVVNLLSPSGYGDFFGMQLVHPAPQEQTNADLAQRSCPERINVRAPVLTQDQILVTQIRGKLRPLLVEQALLFSVGDYGLQPFAAATGPQPATEPRKLLVGDYGLQPAREDFPLLLAGTIGFQLLVGDYGLQPLAGDYGLQLRTWAKTSLQELCAPPTRWLSTCR